MRLDELDFEYPEKLVATEPQEPCRILLGATEMQPEPREIIWSEFSELFREGDLLVRNNTKVVKRRVFSEDGLEILFLNETEPRVWDVLFPARGMKLHEELALPKEVRLQLMEKGLPQKVKVSADLSDSYFEEFGELAIPPYIQKARGDRHNTMDDKHWYQTAWAEHSGSVASPTASLHIKPEFFHRLEARGVQAAEVCLHVGIGTFLPIRSEILDDHQMHREELLVSEETRLAVRECRGRGGRVWALGSTVVRALESDQNSGDTDLFIQPGYQWKYVSGLLTNFHQPKTTLVAMVAAFSGMANLKKSYAYAIEKDFRLFSYGDLSVWMR